MNSTKMFKGEQWKVHNALAILSLIALLKVHNVHLKISILVFRREPYSVIFTTHETFEPLHLETSFLVYRYIFTISRSSLSIKVIGSRSYEKKLSFYLFQDVNPLSVAKGH